MAKVEPLVPRAFASAGELLADAFYDNSAHVYLFPDDASRRVHLRWLLGCLARMQTGFAKSVCVLRDEGTTVDAMAFWHPPGHATLGLAALIRHGVLLGPLRLGLAATRRMFEVDDALMKLRQDADPDLRSWYLSNLVVRQALRGSGLGSSLMKTQLRDVVDASGLPATLMTQRAENVVFYERLGFGVVADSIVGSGPLAFRNWFMRRSAS